MNKVYVNLEKDVGIIRPMHAVNNGPSCNPYGNTGAWGVENKNGNLEEFITAGIPYARTHDASFYPKYGLSHTVDVHAIFPDFDKDPEDPEAYDFTCTDY